MKKIGVCLAVLCAVSCSQNRGNKNVSSPESQVISEPADASPEIIPDTGIFFQVIPSENNTGYGYEIYIDGKMYVHQPFVPAVDGNRSFSTKEKAGLAAGLVVQKIRNNMMPPSLSEKELDSLGLLQ